MPSHWICLLHIPCLLTYTQSPTKTTQTRIPIRPVVKNRNAPSYKVAKQLNDIFKQHLHLDNHYTIDNPTNLAHDLTKLAINSIHKLITLGIKDLYVNIPINETTEITRTQLVNKMTGTQLNRFAHYWKRYYNNTALHSKNKCTDPTKGWPWDPLSQA